MKQAQLYKTPFKPRAVTIEEKAELIDYLVKLVKSEHRGDLTRKTMKSILEEISLKGKEYKDRPEDYPHDDPGKFLDVIISPATRLHHILYGLGEKDTTWHHSYYWPHGKIVLMLEIGEEAGKK